MELSNEELYLKAKNVKVYRVLKPLPGYFQKYKNKGLGHKFNSEILYRRGYNIKELIASGHIKEIPKILPFEKEIIRKNEHSVYTKCKKCFGWSITMPLETECLHCGYPGTITYYDAETIQNYIESLNK